jgi:hypothetical protein
VRVGGSVAVAVWVGGAVGGSGVPVGTGAGADVHDASVSDTIISRDVSCHKEIFMQNLRNLR